MTGPGFAAGMLDATRATVIGEEFTGIDASNAESWLGFMASTVTVQLNSEELLGFNLKVQGP